MNISTDERKQSNGSIQMDMERQIIETREPYVRGDTRQKSRILGRLLQIREKIFTITQENARTENGLPKIKYILDSNSHKKDKTATFYLDGIPTLRVHEPHVARKLHSVEGGQRIDYLTKPKRA